MRTAEQRENARILASYGGVYDNAKLHAMISKMVDRLVAASEKPEQKYDVTLLNSPAINAFALPNGHLYVTRGLIALANDKAELASVLAHEMGHVIARHAEIRQEQARQAALVNHVMTEVVSDPQTERAGARQIEARAGELLARAGIRGRRHRRRHFRARRLRSLRRLALPDRHAAQGRPQIGRRRRLRAATSCPTIPRRRTRVKNALANARQFSGPGTGERDRDDYLADLNGMVYGEDPSEGFVRGRRFLHPKLGFTFLAPPGFTLDNTAQAVLGLKDGGGEAMRLDVVSVPAEQSLPAYLNSGWMENVDPASVRGIHRQRLPGGDRDAQRRAMVVPAVCGALRQRRLPLHLRGQEHDAGGRPLVPRIDLQLPPHEPEGKPGGAARCG